MGGLWDYRVDVSPLKDTDEEDEDLTGKHLSLAQLVYSHCNFARTSCRTSSLTVLSNWDAGSKHISDTHGLRFLPEAKRRKLEKTMQRTGELQPVRATEPYLLPSSGICPALTCILLPKQPETNLSNLQYGFCVGKEQH